MYSLYKHILTALIVTTLFTGGQVAHAQTAMMAGTGQPDPVQYTVAPQVPGPNQQVSIFVDGVGSFLGNSTVTWQKNGVVVSSGIGKNSYTFTTGGIGQVTVIHLNIDSSVQGTISHDFVFNPSLVSLVWEAGTTAPPFYLGKPLYSAGSSAKVVAFPTILSNGALVQNDALSFQWKLNDTLDPSQSGTGKNTFTFIGDELQTSEEVSVAIYQGNTEVGYGDVVLPVSSPLVVVYDQDPLRGEVLDQGLTVSATLNDKEVTLKAEPYYFSTASRANGALQYTWTLNGSEVTGPSSAKGLLTLRQTSSGAGEAQVDVSLQNTNDDTFMQAAQTGLDLTFGTATGSALSNFFGL